MGKKVAELYAEISADTSKLEAGLANTKIGLKGAVGSFTELNSVLTLAKEGFRVAEQVMDETVTRAVEYNKEIREMTQVTGLGAEEISRIVQVGDDWGIELGELRTALAYMNKQGVTPSIDNLASLADSYAAAADKSQWAEDHVKTLGRGYQTLIPILAQGGDALRAQTAAINENLIATEKNISASREYEVVLDDFNDTVEASKLAIGNHLLPAMISLLDPMHEVNENQAIANRLMQDGVVKSGRLALKLSEQVQEVINNRDALDEYDKSAHGAANATRALETAMSNVANMANINATMTLNVKKATEGLANSIYDKALKALGNFSLGEATQLQLQKDLALAFGATTKAEQEQDTAVGYLTKQLELGNITQQQWLDMVNKIASGAISARDAINQMGAAINRLKDKDVNINVHYNVKGGLKPTPIGAEPGPGVPIPVGPPDIMPKPGQPGNQTPGFAAPQIININNYTARAAVTATNMAIGQANRNARLNGRMGV